MKVLEGGVPCRGRRRPPALGSEGVQRRFGRCRRSGDGRGPVLLLPPAPLPRTRRAGWRKSIGLAISRVRACAPTGFRFQAQRES